MIIDIYRVLIIDIYRLGDVYLYLSISMQLDECDIYRYISLFFNNVIYIDKAIFIDIYPLKKFPDATAHLMGQNPKRPFKYEELQVIEKPDKIEYPSDGFM